MSTIIIVLLLIGVVILAIKNSSQHFKGDGGCCGGSCLDHTKIPDKELQKAVIGYKTIHISGMHCPRCAVKVAESINKIEGASAKVNVEDHIAIVSYEREIVNQKLHDAIEKVGYHIISIKD